MITFWVSGQPVPKERPRLGRNGAYTPAKTQAWESTIAWAARSEMAHLNPLNGDLAVYVTFHRKGKRRVDLDNLIKCLDGANGIVWNDDNQITQIHAAVIYGAKTPGMSLKVIPV